MANLRAEAAPSTLSIAPYGPFPAADGTVFFGVQNEREFKVFCSDVLGTPELFADPRFQGNAARVANRLALHEIIIAVFAGLPSERVLQRLDDAGIANARLRTMAELSAHPQLAERERWRNVESPVGPLRSLVPPVTSRESTIRMDPIPGIGDHTATILAELGMPEAHAGRCPPTGATGEIDKEDPAAREAEPCEETKRGNWRSSGCN